MATTFGCSLKSPGPFMERNRVRSGLRSAHTCLTARASEMMKVRKAAVKSQWVFPGDSPDAAILGTSIDHQREDVRDTLKLFEEFVVHSLRHTMLTRLGEAGADAFTIMKIAGHSSVIVSQRYVHRAPEGIERAFERLEELNAAKFDEAKAKPWQLARKAVDSLQKSPQSKRVFLVNHHKLLKQNERALSSAVRAADS